MTTSATPARRTRRLFITLTRTSHPYRPIPWTATEGDDGPDVRSWRPRGPFHGRTLSRRLTAVKRRILHSWNRAGPSAPTGRNPKARGKAPGITRHMQREKPCRGEIADGRIACTRTLASSRGVGLSVSPISPFQGSGDVRGSVPGASPQAVILRPVGAGAKGEIPPYSVPHIPLVIRDLVLVKKFAKFLMECLAPVVVSLRLDVVSHGVKLRLRDGEHPVSGLP